MQADQLIDGNASASLRDRGQGVAQFSIHTRLSVCDELALDLLERVPHHLAGGFQALILASADERAFCAGARAQVFIDLISRRRWDDLLRFLRRGQQALLALKYSNVPWWRPCMASSWAAGVS